MPNRLNPGCGCCEPCIGKASTSTDDFTPVGTLDDDVVRMTGPNRFSWGGTITLAQTVAKEAYIIEGTFWDYVKFEVEGIDVILDGPTRTLTLDDGVTTESETFGDQNGGQFAIYVTPDFIWATVSAYEATPDMFIGALVLIEKSITATGDIEITIDTTDFEIAFVESLRVESRIVTVSGGAITANCWEAYSFPCMKKVLDELSFDNSNIYGDVAVYPSLTLTSQPSINGYPDTSAFAPGTTVLDNLMLGGAVTNYNGTQTSLEEYARGDCVWSCAFWSWLYDDTTGNVWNGGPYWNDTGILTTTHRVAGHCVAQLPAPTVSEPYPPPIYQIRLEASARFDWNDDLSSKECVYTTNGTTVVDVDVNDLDLGNTINCNGTITTSLTWDNEADCETFNSFPSDVSVALDVRWILF